MNLPHLSTSANSHQDITLEKLSEVLHLITENSDVVGFTVAEYLPFDEHRLNKMLSEINIFTD